MKKQTGTNTTPVIDPELIAKKWPTGKQPKMADIARIAGVDVSTVSRALAGNPRVAKKTRELIDQIVRDTGYVVNEAGRNLRDGRAYQVLVIVQDIAAPFYSDVVQGIVALFAEHDINILLGITLGRAKREDDLAIQLLSGGVYGIISLTGNAPQTISNTRDFNRKIVAISRPIPHENVACVTINNYAAAREVMEYLYSMGHRHIVHIGGPNHSETYRLRSAAYVDFMRDHCLDEQINVRSTNSFSDDIESGTAIMRSFLDDGIRPTAVFCATDELAVGAMAAARQANLDIPKDVSFFGFDDLQLAGLMFPALSTVSVPRFEMGHRGAEELYKQIYKDGIPSAKIMLKHQLVIRDSVAEISCSD